MSGQWRLGKDSEDVLEDAAQAVRVLERGRFRARTLRAMTRRLKIGRFEQGGLDRGSLERASLE